MVFGWSRAVIVYKFFLFLGCPFWVLWLENRLLLGLLKIWTHCHFQVARLLISKSRLDKAKGKPKGLISMSLLQPPGPWPVCLLYFFQSLLVFLSYITSSGLSCTEQEEQREVLLTPSSWKQKSTLA